ncbi:MAG TPA: type I glyceraldehyde-3-phosphate dehydrogenase [Candidatus Bipolaricaulota bacterium]|nr:type I glyceraldehyde-3-phosphate dehydrogenase [Candidatus Bipolaricaulota bacterium]
MPIKIAINGFGRIGRAAFKVALENKKIKVVAINDLVDPENLAYLLKYDTVYGRYDRQVFAGKDFLKIDDVKVQTFAEKDPAKLPWEKLGVDVVLECTGFFTDKDGAFKHIKAGAKKVIISAPTKSADLKTFVAGANENKISKKDVVISNASCTTNCVSPIMAIMQAKFGIKKALMTTIHAYTATQKLVDGPDPKDFRRGRAAAMNMSPTSTGAALATVKTLPGLKDKFDAVAVRVPLSCGSLSDFTIVTKKKTTVAAVNKAFMDAAKTARYREVLGVSKEALVSSDIVGTIYSAIVDLNFTKVVDGDLVKIMAWYDNEYAYSYHLVKMVEILASK